MGLRTAADEHASAAQRQRLCQLERERIPRLMRWTDAMIEELEQLNLRGIRHVMAAWRPRLSLLFAALPFEYEPTIRAYPAPSELLDVMFEIQDRLLGIKNGDLDKRLAAIESRQLEVGDRAS
jgi:hypothetical protein